MADNNPDIQFINLIYNDDFGAVPDAAYVKQWASRFGFTNVAALAPIEAPATNLLQESKTATWLWTLDGDASAYYHLDRHLRVIYADEYRPSPPKLPPLIPCKGCQY
jgi:hypothetical protein